MGIWKVASSGFIVTRTWPGNLTNLTPGGLQLAQTQFSLFMNTRVCWYLQDLQSLISTVCLESRTWGVLGLMEPQQVGGLQLVHIWVSIIGR